MIGESVQEKMELMKLLRERISLIVKKIEQLEENKKWLERNIKITGSSLISFQSFE